MTDDRKRELTEVANRNFTRGYDRGYQDGVAEAAADPQKVQRVNDAWQRGYEAGVREATMVAVQQITGEVDEARELTKEILQPVLERRRVNRNRAMFDGTSVTEDMQVNVSSECTACEGTGLFVGMAERDGAAVVCSQCKGRGSEETSVKVFQGRKERRNVKRVYAANPGMGIGTGESAKYGELGLEDFGGMRYEDWMNLPLDRARDFPAGTEMRKFTCPAWWYQSANSELKPSWTECVGVGTFKNCSSFPKKSKCWLKWDVEFGKYATPPPRPEPVKIELDSKSVKPRGAYFKTRR